MDHSLRLAVFRMHHPTDRKIHTHDFCYTSCGALVGMRTNSIDPADGIDSTTNRTLNERSTTKLRPAL